MEKEKVKGNIEIKTEKKPFEKFKNEMLEIKGISIITDKEEQFITQIRFKLSENESLTYKPTEFKEEKSKLKGLETIKKYRVALSLDEVPRKIYFLNELINEFGSIRVITDFTLMNTKDKENQEVSYKFLSYSDFDILYPIDKNNKEIFDKDKEK